MATSNPTGKAILRASLQLFRQDRQMIWLPVMATITAVIAFAIIAGPIALGPRAQRDRRHCGPWPVAPWWPPRPP